MKKLLVLTVLYKTKKSVFDRLQKSIIDNGIPKTDFISIDNTKNNIGYGEAINKIVKKNLNKYKYFFIVNPDVVIKKNCISELVKTLDENPAVGIVGPKIVDEKGKIWSLGGEIDAIRYSGGLVTRNKNGKGFFSVDFVSGTAMLVRRDVFKKIGFFNKDYFLYYEDVDFCVRAEKSGFELAVNPLAVITHFASSSTGKNSPAMHYYMARNHLLFVERYAPLFVKIREIVRLPKTLFQARKRKYESVGIQDYFLRKFGRNTTIMSKADI